MAKTYASLEPYLTLTFTQDSMINASLVGTTKTKTVQYDVSTDATTGSRTTVMRTDNGGEKRELALIRKKEILPDTISFGTGKAMGLKKWLIPVNERFVSGRLETEAMGGLVWRYGDPACPLHSFVLFAEDDLYTPLANFTRHPETDIPRLVLAERVAKDESAGEGRPSILDTVVLSLLVIGQRGRVSIKNLREAGAMSNFRTKLPGEMWL